MGRISIILSLMVLLSAAVPPGSPAAESPGPDAQDRCPVCGMFVAKYPDWVVTLTLKDGTRRYFDGAKDMFKFYLEPASFEAATVQADITGIVVRDYYGLEPLEAKASFFVLGSDVYGPMGHELVPLGTQADAEEFSRDHRGKRILRFDEITPEIVKGLDSR